MHKFDVFTDQPFLAEKEKKKLLAEISKEHHEVYTLPKNEYRALGNSLRRESNPKVLLKDIRDLDEIEDAINQGALQSTVGVASLSLKEVLESDTFSSKSPDVTSRCDLLHNQTRALLTREKLTEKAKSYYRKSRYGNLNEDLKSFWSNPLSGACNEKYSINGIWVKYPVRDIDDVNEQGLVHLNFRHFHPEPQFASHMSQDPESGAESDISGGFAQSEENNDSYGCTACSATLIDTAKFFPLPEYIEEERRRTTLDWAKEVQEWREGNPTARSGWPARPQDELVEQEVAALELGVAFVAEILDTPESEENLRPLSAKELEEMLQSDQNRLEI